MATPRAGRFTMGEDCEEQERRAADVVLHAEGVPDSQVTEWKESGEWRCTCYHVSPLMAAAEHKQKIPKFLSAL
jgi:hypothetical protein